jgi:hypothetical protein
VIGDYELAERTIFGNRSETRSRNTKVKDDTVALSGSPSGLSVIRDAEIARVTQSADCAGVRNQP